jgi:hypothetical protein
VNLKGIAINDGCYALYDLGFSLDCDSRHMTSQEQGNGKSKGLHEISFKEYLKCILAISEWKSSGSQKRHRLEKGQNLDQKKNFPAERGELVNQDTKAARPMGVLCQKLTSAPTWLNIQSLVDFGFSLHVYAC